ncbi:hypothetical protein [uncultured Dokdonia sp.]|uniref:hypothetical protein n=1 Tax=uncultured Dokdonia sp. TaxID=575653 RepID=UPI002634045D|nr:hypothetical protein [uncultured Dokdonia sp.]
MKEQASHTLFRFVSFRSPELIAPQKPSRKFVYELIDDGGQMRVREVSDGTFEERSTGLSILTQNEARNTNQELHDFGAWIQKNRRNFELQEVEDKLQLLSGNSVISDEESIWLNLYHQYKTQEDHGARESLINLIIAKNFVDETKKISRETSEEELLKIFKEIASARIVIPNDVIDVAEAAVPTSGQSVFKRTSAEAEARISSAIATYKLEQLKLAKEELEYVEKQYRKEYDAAYKVALETHNASVKILTDQYKNDLQAEQEIWFKGRTESLKSVTEEEFLFNKVAKTKLPDLPKFEFEFRPEIEAATASRDMSGLLFDTLKSLTIIERIDSFEEAYTLFSKEETRLSEIQIANKKLSSKKISFNGTIISGNDKSVSPSVDVCYTTTLLSETTPVNSDGDWYWEYHLNLEGFDREVNIQDIAYKLTFTNGSEIADTVYITTYTDTTGNTYERTLRIFPQVGGIELDASLGVPAISGTVTLQNGDTLTFDSVLNPNSFITRIITCDELNGDTGGNPDTNTDENFIPSGFGMRQLGIADYRRVEQNVHCYVEGEVSHIENIMAREYKEKSTRRLRRSENTTSTTSETEKEQLTDTSTTDRFEMQNEVAQVIAESTSIDAFANVSGGGELIQFSTGAGFANNTSQEDSISQAVTEAQEITSRAMDRVVQKVKEERITKIIEEYEENNKHGFDNREGDKHVVGVYRWIDKVYKNQIYNYGKRLMYEFFIPEPSRLHKLALTETIEGNEGTVLEKPIDPRTQGLASAGYIFRSSYRSWAAQYNAEVNAPLDNVMYISAAISDSGASGSYLPDYHYPGGKNWTVEIPENYEVTQYTGKFGFTYIHNDFENTNGTINIERNSFNLEEARHGNMNVQSNSEIVNRPIRNELGISFHGGDVGGMSLSLRIKCELTTEAYEAWRVATFNAIITAYEEKLARYNEQFVEQTETATVLRDSNPLFYRQIEQTVLRKNCISYLIDRNQDGERTYGKSGLYEGSILEDAEVKLNQRLDNYTSFATFLEQAIEWDIMSYNFYPFYWANRGKWGELYQYENNDPVFRKFMQAGMARVVVTVRPGFEDAMMHYMATGNVWDGGELPVLDDPLYLSIVEELQQPLGIKEGEAWKTQVPTSLTILQADSIGLKVEKPLPCNCENEKDFQESDQTGCLSGITNEEDVFSGKDCDLGIPGGIPLVQFSLRHFYGNKTIGEVDTEGSFPRTFRCQGQTIEINRDASWLATDSIAVLYQSLATQLSAIPGITARQFDYIPPSGVANGSAVLFTVDFNVIDTFEFEKTAYGLPNGLDKITVNTDGDTVQITFGDDEFSTYLEEKDLLTDSSGTVLSYEDIQSPLPIDRFISETTLTE